jgi:hypothetical protein
MSILHPRTRAGRRTRARWNAARRGALRCAALRRAWPLRAKFGTHGEEATADVLHGRRMRAHGWRVVDGVPFAGFDVDHVALRPGLVIAVETKWTHTPWRFADGRLGAPRDPVGQALANSKTIHHFLRGHAAVDTMVHAVIVVWGPGAETLPEDVVFDRSGAWILRGRALPTLDAWLEPFERAEPSAGEVDRCVVALRAFVRARDEHEAARSVAAG